MLLDTPISEIMTRDPATVSPTARLFEARAIMFERRAHHVPVVEDGELVGIVSTNDLLRVGPIDRFASPARVDEELENYRVAGVMTQELVTLAPSEPIRQAIKVMALGSFSAIPVVEGTRLIGIITTSDVLRFVLARA